jgi:hypothetical protein
MWHITATSDQLVDLNLERVPILDRIPLYLDAHSVEKKQLPSETTQFTDLHTWYTTRAAPEEVEAYYLGELPQHGWTGPEPGSNITTKGVIFGWGTGTFHRLTFYKLSIAASRTSTAETIVHLKIEGTISR